MASSQEDKSLPQEPSELVIAKSGAGFDTASARAIPAAPNSKPAATTMLRISHQIGFMGRAPKSYQEHLPRSLSTRHYKLNTSLASFSQTPPRTEGHKGAIATFSISSPVPTCLRRRARSSRAELLWSPSPHQLGGLVDLSHVPRYVGARPHATPPHLYERELQEGRFHTEPPEEVQFRVL